MGGARRRARRRSRAVRFWAPPRRRCRRIVIPDTGGRHEGVDVFAWTPREFIDEGCSQFLLHRRERREEPDPVHPRARPAAAPAVRRRRRGQAGRGRAARSARRSPMGAGAVRSRRSQASPIVTDLPPLVGGAREFLDPEDGEPDSAWSGRVQPARSPRSCDGCTRRSARLGQLVRAGESTPDRPSTRRA